jgi:hypothetical protein
MLATKSWDSTTPWTVRCDFSSERHLLADLFVHFWILTLCSGWFLRHFFLKNAVDTMALVGPFFFGVLVGRLLDSNETGHGGKVPSFIWLHYHWHSHSTQYSEGGLAALFIMACTITVIFIIDAWRSSTKAAKAAKGKQQVAT